MDLTSYALSIILSLVIGMVGLLGAYKLFDWLTPHLDFPQELAKGNLAVAIFLAGLFIGLGLLLGSAIK